VQKYVKILEVTSDWLEPMSDTTVHCVRCLHCVELFALNNFCDACLG